jgi:ParB family chromosome partitioning protein
MHVQLIECKLIDMSKTDASNRPLSKEFATELAASLRAEGMYAPIVVRPDPAKPGRFLLVQGRHRLYAWGKILKNTLIRADVRIDMDDNDAKMATAAENLWRLPLTKKQHDLAVKHWFDCFGAKNPSLVESGGKGNLRKADPAAITGAKVVGTVTEAAK